MIRRLVEHNQLNGIIFATLEFTLVATAAAFIAVGFAVQHEPGIAVLVAGTAVNSLVIVGYGAADGRHTDRGGNRACPIMSCWSRSRSSWSEPGGMHTRALPWS